MAAHPTLPWPAAGTIAATRNSWLDICRSLAIIMVLLSHGRHFLTPAWEQAAAFRIGGFVGVELFFVLSGFLIGGIAERCFIQTPAGQAWVGRFLIRRWLRTLPNYYLFLIINALLVANAVAPGRLSDLIPFAIFAQNLAWPSPPVFGEAWSLAVEECFYLIFPLGLYFLGKLETDRRKIFLALSIGLLLVPLMARWGAVAFATPTWDDGIRKVVVFRLDALIAGVLAGWLVQELQLQERIRSAAFAVAAALIMLAAGIAFFKFEQTFNASDFSRVWLFPLVSLGCAMTVLAGISAARPAALLDRATHYCARLSYALYLAHMPVLYGILHFTGHTPAGDGSGALFRWSAFIIGSLLVAALVERTIERPILDWRDRTVPR